MTPRTAPSAFFLRLFILTLPFQTGFLLYAQDWGRGIRNPYLTLSFYGWEFFLFLAACFLLWEKAQSSPERASKQWGPWLVGAVACLSTVLLSFVCAPEKDAIFILFTSIKISEFILLIFLIKEGGVSRRDFFHLLGWGMAGQGFLAIAQVILGHSVGLYFLGEPHLSADLANVARFQWGELILLRGYGTFAHPNILGGFLGVALLGTLLHPQHSKILQRALVGILALGLLATFSRMAFLGVGAASFLLPLQKKYRYGLAALLTGTLAFIFLMKGNFWEDNSFQERWVGFQNAFELWLNHPLGIGWRQETLFLDTVTTTPLMPWEYQPVHNVFLLALVELGPLGFFWGMGLFIYGTWGLGKKNHRFLAFPILIFCTGLLDHYWLTSDAARTLLWLLLLFMMATPDHSNQATRE